MQVDQQMLREGAQRFIERAYGFEQRQATLAQAGGFSAQHWQSYADMGWLALGLPAQAGGLGTAADHVVLAETLGQALVVEPWLSNTALCGSLAAELGRTDLAAAMAEGRLQLALAAWELQGRYDAFDTATQASANPDGSWTLQGRKTGVLGGPSAQQLLVLARTQGQARDTAGLTLFNVAANAPGVQLRSLPTYDGLQTADLVLDQVHVGANAVMGELHGAWPSVEAAIDRATTLSCAEAVGAMAKALTLTQTYLSTRQQFGRPITANQVVRHRLVDMYVAIAQARAVTEAAAQALDAPEATPLARRRAVSIAKAFISKAGRAVGEDAVQLHGAIGMTDEVEIGHCYKKLAAFANRFGDVAWHLDRLARNPQPA